MSTDTTHNGWRPMETAPKDGTEVLVWDGRFHWLARWLEEVGAWDVGTDAFGETVFGDALTHWMPLPAPPKQEGASE